MSKVGLRPTLEGMNYKVIRSLGSGAGSSILLVQDSKLGHKYALKVVKRQDAEDDIYIAQARHEFDVACRLNHVSLLKIHDRREKRSWFKTTGIELLMEYVDGRNLDELDNPSLDQLLLIFIHVASGLNHMHRRNVYHGDLKPGNIMLSRTGAVKIIDFGTAWIKGEDKGRVQGTPQYMAPEQATERFVDDRTDLYNFGATMYRLLTREYANLAIPGIGDGGVGVKKKPRAPIQLNDEVPGTLNETIMACLEPNRDRRPAGVFEVKHQLVAVARYRGLSSGDLKGSEGEDDDD